MKNNTKRIPPKVLVLTLGTFLVSSLSAQQWFAEGPLPRSLHSAVLDIPSNRMIVFGGITALLNGSGENLNDVWWLVSGGSQAEDWVPASITGDKPSPRSGSSAVYDASSNHMVIFGGALAFASPCANDL